MNSKTIDVKSQRSHRADVYR